MPSNQSSVSERPMRILHVDDDRAFADLTAEFISTELPTADIVTETSATSGLERLADQPFDCVVSDYDMPEMDGLEFLETLREEYPDLPFILYTGKGSETIAEQAINTGVTGYLQKGGPEQHRRLANRIDHAVEEYVAKHNATRYSTVLRALDYPVYVVDADGVFEYVNDAFVELTGYDRERLIGSEPSLIKSDESVQRANDAVRTVVSSTGPDTEQFDVEIHPANSEPVPCRDHLAPLPFDTEFRGCAGILRDISDQEQREAELVRQNERLEEFVSVVSHDLRTPLHTASSAAELAQETGEDTHFEQLDRAHTRMHRMLDELLTLAREGESVEETTTVNIPTVAAEAWDSIEADAGTLDIECELAIRGEYNRIRRLFENLFTNAVEHGDGATTTVGTLGDREGFYVADDGPGIDPDDRAKVFEAGFTTASDGTGFGLSIVNRIAEAHGWEVSVSESEAGGARFEFTDLTVAAASETDWAIDLQ